MSFIESHDKHLRHVELPSDFIHLNPEKFDPDIWGPHYWFFLETVCHTYPNMPTATTKRKYYDLIQNMPLFIPNPEIGNKFSSILDNYPVSPYLDTRDSFIRWVHFIHNKINVLLSKEEISLFKALDNYRQHYKPKQILLSERYNIKVQYIHFAFILIFIVIIFIYMR